MLSFRGYVFLGEIKSALFLFLEVRELCEMFRL